MKKLPLYKFFIPFLATLGLILTHIIWGANFVVAKQTLNEFPIMILSFLRFSISIVLLLPFILIEHKYLKTKINYKDLPRLFLIGLFLITFHITLFYEGLKRTSALDASVLSLIIPILSVLAGWVFLKEKIFWVNLVGIFLSLGGALVVLGIPLYFIGALNYQTLLGNILIILSSFSFIIGAIFSKKMLKIYSSLTLTIFSFLVGSITFFAPALIEHLRNPNWTEKITIIGIGGLIFIIVLSTISAFFLYEWALKKLPLSQAAIFGYLQPAVAATLAVPLLGERISFSLIIGTCLIILGVYWGTLGKEHHHYHIKHHS